MPRKSKNHSEIKAKKTVRLHHILAPILEMDAEELRKKLSNLPEEIAKILQDDKKFAITGVVELYPLILPPGEFYHSKHKKKVQVPARVSTRARVNSTLLSLCKQKRLETKDYF